MDNRRLKIFTIGVITLAAISRLVYLGIFPPGGNNSFWLRLPTSVAGITSIILLMLLIQKLSKNTRLSLVSGLMLSVMPWHIEQSRVYSTAMLGLTVLMIGALVYMYAQGKLIKLIVALATSLVFYFVYPDFWLFTQNGSLPTLNNYLNNMFKLISVEFLFFKNDSFWSGGFRMMGALLPSFIPLLIVGLFTVFQKLQLRHWRYFIPVAVIWLISAANPLFPEGREFFLIIPYLALVLAIGVIKVIEQLKISTIVIKVLITVLMFFVSYEYILFTHFYTTHYSQRIGNEIPHEKLVF